MILGGLRRVWANRWGKQALALVGGLSFFWGMMQLYLASPWQLLYNDTSSEARGIYLLEKFQGTPRLHLGELVDFHYVCPLKHGRCLLYSEAPYATGSQAMKRVGALPGDVLNVVGPDVYMRVPGSAHWKLLGRRYTFVPGVFPPQRVLTYAERDWRDYRIPDGYFYGESQRVAASFDSRYYGLDRYSQLIGHPVLLWRVNLDGFFNLLNGWI
jgi:type IV secretory pathway protease TraF